MVEAASIIKKLVQRPTQPAEVFLMLIIGNFQAKLSVFQRLRYQTAEIFEDSEDTQSEDSEEEEEPEDQIEDLVKKWVRPLAFSFFQFPLGNSIEPVVLMFTTLILLALRYRMTSVFYQMFGILEKAFEFQLSQHELFIEFQLLKSELVKKILNHENPEKKGVIEDVDDLLMECFHQEDNIESD
jgi:hypothetical protein